MVAFDLSGKINGNQNSCKGDFSFPRSAWERSEDASRPV